MLLTTLALLLAPPTAAAPPVPTTVVDPVRPAVELAAQDEEEAGAEKPDKRPEIAALLDELAGHVKKRGKEDEQAIALIDKLVQEFPESGPKDRKAIVAELDKCLKAKRAIELEPGVPDDRLHNTAAVALGTMGPDSVKTLTGWIDHKSLRESMATQRYLILSLGKTTDPKGVEPLLGLLKHADAAMQSAGAEALAYFAEIEQKTRKDIVNDLIKCMMGQKARVDSAPTDQEARERWDIISGPIVESLKALTGADIGRPEEWQRWWNKNKKEDWDAKD